MTRRQKRLSKEANRPAAAKLTKRSRGTSIASFGALNLTLLKGSDRGDHVGFMISRRHVSKTAMLAIAFVSFATLSRSSEFRDALWPVVQACRVNHDLTGAAFPCLEVNVSGGADRGYVVLRPPFGLEDFILAPTRKIVGVEDRSLQAADAPNYFNDAWNARGVLATKARGLPERDEVALAINSGLKRTQDQLHIHIGCISPRVRSEIQAIAPALSETRWQRLGRPIGGLLFWAH
jgi:CDP-diacylglycerol pyrophosphatase